MIGKARPMKSEINFDKEMKKHGIDKDIASVRSSRQILQSSSPQSVSPNLMLPVMQSKAKEGKDRNLEIKTSFKTSDVGVEPEVGQVIAPGSGKSESYMFPFHKRSRSLSPDP
jgi:hypothetical protein